MDEPCDTKIQRCAITELQDQTQPLRIWEKLGDRIELALAWNDVAELDIRLGKFRDALTYARKAMDSVGWDAPVSARDRIAVRQTLGFALCGSGRASEAVPLMKEAMQVAQATSGAESLDMGVAEYSLGFSYWRTGDVPNAGKWMRQGLALLEANREWGRGPYLHAMTQYATFLQQQGRTDEALSMEREIRIENSIIDVSALQPPPQ